MNRFGIIVELGDGIEGLVHVAELASQAIQHPNEVVQVGSLIRAKVLHVNVLEKKVGLSRKRVAP
jgi:ribosomal protein S1